MRLRTKAAIAPVLLVAACAHPAGSTKWSGECPRATETGRPFALRDAYHVVDGRTGARLEDAEVARRLHAARAIFVGEQHADPMSHFAEQEVLERVGAVDGPTEMALGLEMLPRSKQPALTRFVSGQHDEAAFLAEVDWDKTWGFDYGFYRPLLELCRAHGAAAHALNAERALVHRVAEVGLDGLSPDEKRALPEMIVGGTPAHREFVRQAFLAHHAAAAHGEDPHRHDAKPSATATATPPTPVTPAAPVDEKEFERFYQAQLVWDETMADSIARVVRSPGSARHLVVVAGAGHCRRDAVPARLMVRSPIPTRTGLEPPALEMLIVLPARAEDVAALVADQSADLLWVPGK